MQNPDPTFLVHMAMADAYAMAVEFVDRTVHEGTVAACQRMEGYVSHPTFLAHVPGRYTDDTEMTVANVRVLLASDGPWTRAQFARAYAEEYRRGGGRAGYSRGFKAVLDQLRNPDDLLAALRPNSVGNGAAMRSVPFGALPLLSCLDVATEQARVTHDTPAGLFSARAIALLAHFAFHRNDSLIWALEFCQDSLPPEDQEFVRLLSRNWQPRPVQAYEDSPLAVETVQAVFHILAHGTSLRRLLLCTITVGGDTDTVAALCWGIASCRFPREVLPAFFSCDLEGGNPQTNAAALTDLGRQFMEKYT